MKNERNILWISLGLLFAFLLGLGLSACATKPAVVDLDLSVQEANQLYQEGIYLLDVRTPEEYQAGHLPGATLIPLDQLSARSSELPQDEPILVYCRSGNRSKQAQILLLGAGFTEVYHMERGINSWIQAGYEIEVGE